MRMRLASLAWLTAVTSLMPASAAAQEEPVVELRLKSPPGRGQSVLRLEGKTLLPNDATLKGTLFRLEEKSVRGSLVTDPVDAGRQVAAVAERKLAFQFSVDRPGRYRLLVELAEDRQDPVLLPAIRKFPITKWTFDVAAWGDDWILQLGPKLGEIDRFARDAIALVEDYAQAAASKESWSERRPKLEKEADKLVAKFDETKAHHFFAAASREIRESVRNLKGNFALLQYGEDGKCKGPINYMTKKAGQTIHQEDFTFARVKKDIEEATTLAGREFCLWLVHDVKRAGERRPAVVDALRLEKRRSGVADLAPSIESANASDLEGVERQIRNVSSK